MSIGTHLHTGIHIDAPSRLILDGKPIGELIAVFSGGSVYAQSQRIYY